MTDGYGDYHTDQHTNAPFEVHPTLMDLMAREAYADMIHARNKAIDCRKRRNEHEAQKWDEKEAKAEREWNSYVSQRGGG